MENFVKLDKNLFSKILPGTFIKWKKKTTGKLSCGGFVLNYPVKKNYWNVQIPSGKILKLNWEKMESVLVMKQMFLNEIDLKINNLSEKLDILVDLLSKKINKNISSDFEVELSRKKKYPLKKTKSMTNI